MKTVKSTSEFLRLKAIKPNPKAHCDTWTPEATKTQGNIIEVPEELYSRLKAGEKLSLRRTRHCDTWDPTQG